MSAEELPGAKFCKYRIDVPIDRPVETAWSRMTKDINEWWMNDFRMFGEDSFVSLNAQAGGALVEQSKSGDSLEWYRVQMCQQGKSLFLNGYLAPDWGGPTLSMLKLALQPQDASCILTVTDVLMGNVSERSAMNAEDGWTTLFRDGLKPFAEA